MSLIASMAISMPMTPVSGVRIRVLSATTTEARVEVTVRANATYSSGAHVLWSQPTSGDVALWSTDSFGNPFAGRSFGPYSGMRATHYQRSGFPSAKLLWTRPDGLLKIWNLDAYDNLDGEGVFRAAAPIGAFTAAYNVSGQPGASVPAGVSKSGLPIGVQLVGPPAGDRLVVSAAAALEEALGTDKLTAA